MTNQPSPFHGPTTPAPFVFDDQSKVLYVRLQYGSLLPYEIQEWDIPFVPIDLSRIVYCPDEGAGSDNVEMAFRDDWLLGHLLPRVLLSMDSFFESHGLDWSPSNEIRERLPSEDRTCSERATMELLSFSFPHDPMVQFNVRRLKAAVAQFFRDCSGATEFYVFIHLNGELSCILRNSLRNVVLSTNDRCINDLYAGRDVESAVEEMSAAMDVAIADSQKMLFSNVKTLVVDPKQQRAPTSILKRGTKTDVGKVVTPPASLPPEMVSDEKPFQRPPGAQHGHPASGRSSTTDANLDARHDDKKTTRNSRAAKDGINLGLYDCSDDASDEFAFSGGTLDDGGNPLETETAAQPPDRSGAGADARFASQHARRQPQDAVSVSNGCKNNAAMGSSGFGGGSSDDSSSDSSSSRDSARHSVSSRRRRRRKRRRSKGRSDPPWDRFSHRNKFSHRKSKREIESGRRKKGFVKGTTWMHYLFVPSRMLIDPDTHVHLPWLAAHLTHGRMLCHPVTIACQFADSELFLSNFNGVPPQTDLKQAQKGHAAFVKMFPVFQKATSLITYCYEIVRSMTIDIKDGANARRRSSSSLRHKDCPSGHSVGS
jgi:hypothetical protein